MRITKKIVMMGNSLGVVIDKPILEKLKLKRGDLLELKIKKLSNERFK